ncbi:MAG TPA: phosphate-starvation-inducible PsiE family protein [Rectinemataceae bacterium]|nr:phosphate-starvation-inducible PsiE family protein [Rectinemataceae bacterium]
MNFKFPDMANLFERFLRWAVNILILYIIFILAIGLVKTLAAGRILLGNESFTVGFPLVISDILSFLVIIELFKGFVDYFKAKRFSLHGLLDPAIIFVLREMIVSLYGEQPDWKTLLGFSLLILVLAVARTLAVKFSPSEEHT